MSIGVQSVPELYTLLMGWDLYDKLWNLLTKTGLAYLPFIGMILSNVARSYVDHHAVGKSALRKMEVELIATLLLIMFAAVPCVPLSAHAVSYSPVCGVDQGKTFYPKDTNTTYDKAFAVPSDNILLPMWWYVVISVSEGITHAAKMTIQCAPDLRKMVTQVNMTNITNPQIKQELQDFEKECYLPARIKFNQDRQLNHSAQLNRIESNIKKHGVEDTEWLGSHGFSEVYYANLNASRPIPGFYYDSSQDINADVNQAHPPAYGTPSCFNWWNDSQSGLKNRVYQTLPKSFMDEYRKIMGDVNNQDDVIKRIINHDMNGYDSANHIMNEGGYSHTISSLGIWFNQLEEYPKLYAAIEAAPIIQAILLLMIYAFLPFALMFSSFRAKSIVTGAMLIFSLILWSFIWHLVNWADSTLMQALYTSWFAKQGASATLADMIIVSLIIFAPIFWFMLMGAMGAAVGDVVSNLSIGANKIGADAGGKGAKVTKDAAVAIGKSALL